MSKIFWEVAVYGGYCSRGDHSIHETTPAPHPQAMEAIHKTSTAYYNNDRDLETENRQVATMICELRMYDDFKLPCKLIHCAKMRNKDIEIALHCTNMRSTDIENCTSLRLHSGPLPVFEPTTHGVLSRHRIQNHKKTKNNEKYIWDYDQFYL